jgi:hypothetical protein
MITALGTLMLIAILVVGFRNGPWAAFKFWLWVQLLTIIGFVVWVWVMNQ